MAQSFFDLEANGNYLRSERTREAEQQRLVRQSTASQNAATPFVERENCRCQTSEIPAPKTTFWSRFPLPYRAAAQDAACCTSVSC